MRHSRMSNNRGFLMMATLAVVGSVSLLLATYLSIVTHEINSVSRATGRAQALYLAEAGLDAANDLLAQDWRNAQRGRSRFPMQETLAVTADGPQGALGDYEVVVSAIDADTLRLTSTGRSVPVSGDEPGAQPVFQITRTLSMVVVRKEKPLFRRLGRGGTLELTATYWD